MLRIKKKGNIMPTLERFLNELSNPGVDENGCCKENKDKPIRERLLKIPEMKNIIVHVLPLAFLFQIFD